MLRKRILVVLAVFYFSAGSLLAGTPRILSPRDIVKMRGLQGIAISPDGASVAYVVTEPWPIEQSKEPINTEIWLTDGNSERRLTNNPGPDSSPQWSPDGSTIAFLSRRAGDEGTQIYLMGAREGEARRLTHHGSSIASFAWSPDGRSIAFLARVPLTAEERRQLEIGDDASVLTSLSDDVSHLRPQKLWILDRASGSETLVRTGAENIHVFQFAWAPAGDQFALLISDQASVDYEQIRTRLTVVGADGGEAPTYCKTQGRLARPQWRPDGKAVSYLGASAGGREPAASSLYICSGSGSDPVNLTEKMPFTVSAYRWLPSGKELFLTITERNSRYLAHFDPATRKVSRISNPGDVVSTDFSLSSGASRIALGIETPSTPADVWFGPVQGQLNHATHLNPNLEQITYGKTEDVSWKAKDGLEITGVLVKPVGYEPGKRYPLIVVPHGGPEGADLNGFQIIWGQFFASHGYAVLLPNFRGSTGRGVEYTLMDNTDFGGKDIQDILSGVDELVSRGIADTDQVGIGGWSYGGFMTSWAVTQTDRFKAAVMGAGVSNWFGLMGEGTAPEWTVQVHFEAWPWDDPHAFRKNSPIEFVKQVRTPVLILHGEKDGAIPVSQARGFFRALQHYHVPSEFVIYPREGHSNAFREPAHMLDMYKRVLEWYDRYVKGNPKT